MRALATLAFFALAMTMAMILVMLAALAHDALQKWIHRRRQR
jgi:hypothetical protein